MTEPFSVMKLIETITTVKSFTDMFKKDKRVEDLYNGIIEKRLQAILENTIELCVTRFKKELPEEMVKYILENEKVLEKVVDSIFSKEMVIDDDILIEGYGLTKDTQKTFIEFFFLALQTAMLRDIEIRRLFRQSEVYIEVDKIYDMTSVIYKKVDRIEDIFNEIKQLNTLMEKKINNIVKDNIVKLKFYLADYLDPADKMDKLTIKDLKEPEKITAIKEEIRELVDKINSIKLIKKEEAEKKQETTQPMVNLFDKQIKVYSIYGDISAEVKADDKKKVKELLSKYLGIDIDENEFFNIGNLTKARVPDFSFFGLESKNKYNGQDSEIEKKEFIGELQLKLEILESYYGLADYLDGFSLMPLVISNGGKILNSGLDIRIKLSKKYELLDIHGEEMVMASYLLKYYDEKLFEMILSHRETHKVRTFPQGLKNMPQPVGPIFRECSIEEKIEQLIDDLEKLFDYELYQEKEYNILKYSFPLKTNTLRPNEMMALPTYLFIKADEPIIIEYEIISDQNIDNGFELLTYNV